MLSAKGLEKKVGIIGGGQLGKMMIQEAKKMGVYVTILDPVLHCPAHSLCDEHIVADFHDEEALYRLAEKSDVLTYEFEHIGVEVLKGLEARGHVIYPCPQSLGIIQNKYLQKKVLETEGLPVPAFIKIDNMEDLQKAGEDFGYPFLLKACTGGYDGKGNVLIKNQEEIQRAYGQLGGGEIPLMAEIFVPFEKEVSLLACRSTRGEIALYPVGENFHEDNILIETRVPADISKEVSERALQLGHRVMEVFAGVGMFCVEMFVTGWGEVYINEVAPRPHNSGHYSIEGCVTSQFEQHMRAILELPLGETTLFRPTVMINLLGEEGHEGKAIIQGLEEALKLPGVKVHIYGKKETAPKRKMGHVTVTASGIEEAVSIAEEATKYLKIVAGEER
ncbi:MAG: 5-(carboxyamino)imidazole ribonucleotide synthase [Thermotaleaceae bacterium]